MNNPNDPSKAADAAIATDDAAPEAAEYHRDHHHDSEADFIPGALADAAIIAEEEAGDVGNGTHT